MLASSRSCSDGTTVGQACLLAGIVSASDAWVAILPDLGPEALDARPDVEFVNVTTEVVQVAPDALHARVVLAGKAAGFSHG